MSKQTKYMSYVFACYTFAMFFSVIGKILHYFLTFEVNKTELGYISNWYMSLGLMFLAGYYQFLFNREVFPPKHYKNLTYRLNRVSEIVVTTFIILTPRYLPNGTPIIGIYEIKFFLVFLQLLVVALYFIVSSRRIYGFIQNKMLRRKMQYSISFYTFLILVFLMFLTSSLYGAFTGIYYSWGYFLALLFMILGSISGYFAIIHTDPKENELITKTRSK
jgi:hypothetical protein